MAILLADPVPWKQIVKFSYKFKEIVFTLVIVVQFRLLRSLNRRFL